MYRLWNVLSAVIKRLINTVELVREVSGTTVQPVDKLSLKLLILFTIVDKLNQKKSVWCYRLILRAVVSEELVEP